MIDLSQQELKLLVGILESVNYKLDGAEVTLPLFKKLKGAILPEPEKDKPVDGEVIKP